VQNADPFATLIRHMRLLGHALTVLCVAWVAVVSLALLFELRPNQLHNHRSPEVKEQIAQCSGEFSERYDCSEEILLSGERIDVVSLALRVAVASVLPGIAWAVWTAAMRRTRQMCAVVAARILYEQQRRARIRAHFVQAA
jgi:hypothetical protein